MKNGHRRRLKAWPIIRRKGPKWVVDCRIRGKGARTSFTTEEEAQAFSEQARARRDSNGEGYFTLTPAQKAQAEEAFRLLAPFGADLVELVKAHLPHLECSQGRTLSVSKIRGEMIPMKKADGASPRYLYDIQSKLKTFEEDFGKRDVGTISTRELDAWLRGMKNQRTGEPVNHVTRNNYRRVLGVVFSWLLDQGYIVSNPVPGTAQAKGVDSETGILASEELARLLGVCDETLIPYLSIGAFAGVRVAEIQRLDWSDVDLVHGKVINIKAKNAKTATRRLVGISDNLLEWLMPHAQRTGPVCPPECEVRRKLQEARREAGIAQWPHNALRHSYASYHLAKHNDAPALALELGHTKTDLLFKHYRAIVTKSDAERYWNIYPTINNEETKIERIAS